MTDNLYLFKLSNAFQHAIVYDDEKFVVYLGILFQISHESLFKTVWNIYVIRLEIFFDTKQHVT